MLTFSFVLSLYFGFTVVLLSLPNSLFFTTLCRRSRLFFCLFSLQNYRFCTNSSLILIVVLCFLDFNDVFRIKTSFFYSCKQIQHFLITTTKYGVGIREVPTILKAEATSSSSIVTSDIITKHIFLVFYMILSDFRGFFRVLSSFLRVLSSIYSYFS